MGKKAVVATQKLLGDLGVEMHFGKKIAAFERFVDVLVDLASKAVA